MFDFFNNLFKPQPQQIQNLGAAVLKAEQGGTGIGSYLRGDLIFASTTSLFYRLATSTNGTVLKMTGGIPAWGVDSTGASAATWLISGTTMTATDTVSQLTVSLASTTLATTTLSTGYLYGDSANQFIKLVNGVGSSLNYSSSSVAVGTNIITFTTNGNEQARFDSSGRLGISTTSPAYTLTVGGTIYSSGNITSEGNFTGLNISVSSTTNWNLGYAYRVTGTSTSGVTLSGNQIGLNGNVVMGTSTAGLSISSNNIGLTIIPTANGGTGTSTTFTSGSIIFSNGSSLNQNNANLFWDNTNSRLGIGTTGPARKLAVQDTGANFQAVFGDDNTSLGLALGYDQAGWTNSYIYNLYSGADGSNIHLGFGFTPGSNVTMTLQKSGNVGIGTTTPAYTLDDWGQLRVHATTTLDSNLIFTGATSTLQIPFNATTSLRITDATNTYMTIHTTSGGQQIVMGADVAIGSLAVTANGGAVNLVDMSVTSAAASSTEESYTFNIDSFGTPILKIKALSDGTGSINTPQVQIGGALSVTGAITASTTLTGYAYLTAGVLGTSTTPAAGVSSLSPNTLTGALTLWGTSPLTVTASSSVGLLLAVPNVATSGTSLVTFSGTLPLASTTGSYVATLNNATGTQTIWGTSPLTVTASSSVGLLLAVGNVATSGTITLSSLTGISSTFTGALKATAGTISTSTNLVSGTISIDLINATDTALASFKKQYAITLTRVSCNSVNGTTTFNLTEMTEASPNSGGTAQLSASLVCGVSGTASSTSFADGSIAANAPVVASTTAIAGSSVNTFLYIDYLFTP